MDTYEKIDAETAQILLENANMRAFQVAMKLRKEVIA